MKDWKTIEKDFLNNELEYISPKGFHSFLKKYDMTQQEWEEVYEKIKIPHIPTYGCITPSNMHNTENWWEDWNN